MFTKDGLRSLKTGNFLALIIFFSVSLWQTLPHAGTCLSRKLEEDLEKEIDEVDKKKNRKIQHTEEKMTLEKIGVMQTPSETDLKKEKKWPKVSPVISVNEVIENFELCEMVSQETRNHRTPISYSSSALKKHLKQFSSSHKTSPSLRNSWSWGTLKPLPSLGPSLSNSSAKAVSLLLNNNYSSLPKEELERRLLYFSAAGMQESVDNILQSSNVDVNATNLTDGETSLHLSALHGHLGVTNSLIKHGARSDLRNAQGRLPVQEAAWGGRPDTLEALLQKTKFAKLTDSNNNTLVHLVAFGTRKINSDEIQSLENASDEKKEDIGLMIRKIKIEKEKEKRAKELEDREKSLNLLVEKHKLDVNAVNKDKHTALHLVSFLGISELVGILLDLGADPDITDTKGKTPCDLAKEQKHDSVVDKLQN